MSGEYLRLCDPVDNMSQGEEDPHDLMMPRSPEPFPFTNPNQQYSVKKAELVLDSDKVPTTMFSIESSSNRKQESIKEYSYLQDLSLHETPQ
jgi:hypothetical protein